MEEYSTKDLVKIVTRSANIFGVPIDDDAAVELACRSRGTPRIANRLLKRVRDFAEVKNSPNITREITRYALDMMEVDELGLDYTDRKIILTMIDKFKGKPVGLDTLAASTGEEANTIEDVYEPYLLQIGFIARTPRGRICLDRAYEHFNREMPQSVKEQIKDYVKNTNN